MGGAALRAAFLVALALAPSAGCGYLAAGIAGGAAAQGGSGGKPGAPTLTIESSTDRASLASATEIRIEYSVADPAGGPVDVDATWALASGGVAAPLTLASGSDPLSSRAASSSGTAHSFVWDAAKDLRDSVSPAGTDKVRDVVLTLTPRRGALAGRAVSRPIKAGNTAPGVEIVAPSGRATRIVATDLRLTDEASDPVSVRLFVSGPGIARTRATIESQSTGLATSPTGADARVFWDSAGSVGIRNVTVTVEVTATDGFLAAGTATADVRIENDSIPSVQILSVGTASGIASVDGRIPVRFAVFDAEAEEDADPQSKSRRPDVRIQVSADGGQSFVPATGLALREGGRDLGLASLAGLRALPFQADFDRDGENVHTFLWDALADGMGGVGELNVLIHVTPIGAGGVEGQSDTFALEVGESVALFGAETLTSLGGADANQMAFGDLDQDGLLDLVVVNSNRGAVSVLLGTGGGAFGAPARLAAGGTPSDVALGDLDRDGLLDLVVANRDLGGDVRVRLGAGGGGFGPEAVIPASGGAAAVGLADLDEDGRLDLVVVSAAVGVRLGRGDGTFGPEASFAATEPFVLGDFDGDGHLDLVAGRPLGVRLGAGDGSFGPEALIPGLLRPTQFAAGDLDRDGRLDLVLNISGQILRGTGGGGFGVEPITGGGGLSTVSLGDIDQDGRLDLVHTSSNSSDLTARLGTGGVAFGAPVRFRGGGPAVLADFNGDGRLDVLGGVGPVTLDQSVTLRLGTGGGGFGHEPSLPAGAGPVVLSLGDLDQDGRLDVVAGNRGSRDLSVLLGTGGGGFQAMPAAPAGGIPEVLSPPGDLDGDGRLDLVVVTNTAFIPPYSAFVWLGRGDGTFAAGVSLTTVNAPASVALGDLDGDGRLDIVVADPGWDDLGIYLGTGGGGFQEQARVPAGNGPLALSLGDLDGDGRLDVVVADSEFDRLLVRLGTGGGAFGGEARVGAGSRPFSVALGDLDGDGRLDIVSGHFDGDLSVRRGVGGGAFGAEERLTAGLGTEVVGLGDVDGDGRLDIVAGNAAREILAFRARPEHAREDRRPQAAGRGNGQGWGRRLLRHVVPVAQIGWRQAPPPAVADLTGDGVADIAVPGAGVQVLVSSAVAPSRRLAALAGLVPGGAAVRAIPVAPLDLGLATPALPAGVTRFAQASLAEAFLPEAATLTATAQVAIDLHASLTAAELTGGVLRVFRHEPDLVAPSPTAAQIDKRFGRPFYGRIVEVARRDPAHRDGAGFPDGIVPATVSETAGTISFPVTRLGRYQAFLEAPTLSAVIFRETFDADGPSSGIAPRPSGWFGSELWQAGAPSATALARAERPPPGSAPSLLALGLRTGEVKPSVVAPVTSPTFRVNRTPTGRTPKLRFLLWHDLEAGDTVRVGFVLVDATTGQPFLQVYRTYPDAAFTPQDPPALAEETIDLSSVPGLGDAIEDAIAATGADPDRGTEVRLRLEFVEDGDGLTGRGFFIDDVEIVLE